MPLKRLHGHIRENLRPGRFGRSLSLSLMQSLIETGCLTLAVLVVARLFGPELFGRLGLYLIGVQFVSVLADGLLASQVKSVSEKIPSGLGAAARVGWQGAFSITGAATLLTLLLFLVIAAIRPARLELELPLLLIAAAAAVTRVAKSTMEAACRGLHSFGPPLKVGSTVAVAQAATLIGAAALGYRVAAYLAIMTGFQMINALGLALIFRRRYQPQSSVSGPDGRADLAQMFGYSVPLLLRSLVTFLSLRANVVLIACFSTERDVGNYRLAEQFLNLIMLVVGAMLAPFAPKVAELSGRGEKERLQTLTSRVHGALLVFGLAAALVFFFNAPLVTRLFPEYGEASRMITVLTLLPLSFALSYPLSIVLVQGGKAPVAFWISVGGGLLNLALVALLARTHGGLGAVWGTMTAHLTIGLATIVAVKTLFGLKIRPRLRPDPPA